jgi:hypothetical protein
VTNVTGLELALIPAGAALFGVALGTIGNAYLDRVRERRTAKHARDQAIAELLTATVDLTSGVQTVRVAYMQQTAWRHYLRIAAATIAALGLAPVPGDKLTLSTLLQWPNVSPVLDRLLAVDRELDANQRVVALDLATVVAPRAVKFYAAIAVLTLGPDKEIANAVRELAPAVGGLLEVIAAKEPKYARARARVERALGEFRDIVDQRSR